MKASFCTINVVKLFKNSDGSLQDSSIRTVVSITSDSFQEFEIMLICKNEVQKQNYSKQVSSLPMCILFHCPYNFLLFAVDVVLSDDETVHQ